MTKLFDALKRAGCGDNYEGVILVDGSQVYSHWAEDGKVFFESRGEDAAFTDQDVEFDELGNATVADIDARMRQIRILVMVPFSAKLQTLDLISTPESEANR